jgi:hypothetical protein
MARRSGVISMRQSFAIARNLRFPLDEASDVGEDHVAKH